MELVEGRTLREAIADGPLSIRLAWSIARQLRRRPGRRPCQRIGRLRFETRERDADPRGRRQDSRFRRGPPGGPRIRERVVARHDHGRRHSRRGGILGTVGYMSPEQATGRNVDFHSDQFSFGAVIYELLAGQRAFQRPTAVETLSAILRDEPPPLASTRADAPDALQRVIGRCLEKAPEQRFASTRELATALRALMPESSTAVAPSGTALAGSHPPRPPHGRALSRVQLAVLAAVDTRSSRPVRSSGIDGTARARRLSTRSRCCHSKAAPRTRTSNTSPTA